MGQQSQHRMALGLPPIRESPPCTPDDLLVLLLVRSHELYQLVIYMHQMMMQHLVILQQQLLKLKYIQQATKLVLPTKVLSYLLLPLTCEKHDVYYLSN